MPVLPPMTIEWMLPIDRQISQKHLAPAANDRSW